MDYIIRSILLAVVSATSVGNYITKTFEDGTNTGNFNHLIIDRQTGKLYLGAVNRLYLLTESLSKETSIDTGPELDSPKCPPVGDCICGIGSESDCEMYKRKPYDSISQALEIDYTDATLITCVNLFQGMCQKLHLEDLTPLDPPIKESYIVPNDWESPAVVFIAPGVPDSSKNNVLYVAATRSTIGLDIYNDLIPAAASRNLQNFEIAYEGIVSASRKEFEHQQRSQFRVRYITGFSSGGFSYFVTVQRDSVNMNTNYSTKIIRVCQNDAHYYSYTEVPLKCSYLGTDYNILRAAYVTHPGGELARDLRLSHLPPFTDAEHVLFAVFSRSEPQSPDPIADSVLCIYPVVQISEVFTKTIQNCFKGIGNTGPAHIVTIAPCVPTNIDIDDNYCGTYELNTPISGTIPMAAGALLRFEETLVTSLAVTYIHDFTVAFVGTDNGTLKKVVIESKTTATEYESLTVDSGSKINEDMDFDRPKNHIYVMSEKKVTMIKLQECAQYQSCAECLGAKDPYCGWCALENKCSVKGSCKDSEQLRRWLPYSGVQCTRIIRVVPSQVQIKQDTASKLVLTIQNLPALTTGDYQCAFSHVSSPGTTRTRTTSARVSESTSGDSSQIQCETPIPNLLPRIPTGKDHIIMQLSVRMNGRDFVSQNFTFFDCRLHQSCSSCTDSEFPCTWCVENHTCTNNQENCLEDVLITGRKVQGATDRPGPMNCPRIEASFTEILVPSGTPKEVEVKVLNLQKFQENFKCYFNIDGGREVTAFRTQGTDFIKCDAVFFEYSGLSPHRNVPFHITWGSPTRPLDNPDSIQVKVYKCKTMAGDCGTCLTMDPKFKCGWCDGQCSIQQQCTASSWLDHNQICPNPFISWFHPTTGPREGGTRVTIEGGNLGKVVEDIKDGVTVAGIPCEVDANDYSAAKRVVCTTGRVPKTTSGHVQVVVNNRFRGQSQDDFSYVRPKIQDFHPKKGPQAGGTKVTVSGRFMNSGTHVQASIGDLVCNIIGTEKNQAICLTSPALEPKIDYLIMRIDMSTVTHDQNHFRYTRNPQISSVYPQRGILSGGLKINVHGNYLSSVQEPQMYVMLKGGEFFSDCDVLSDTEMTCLSPNITAAVPDLSEKEQPFKVPFGFIMDNVTELRNLTAYDDARPVFGFVQDPTFESFTKGVKHFQLKNEYLTINGEHLNLALTKSDVTVMVGTAFCNVTSIADQQLTCRPPAPSNEGVGNNPKVTVIVGRNLSITIGFLRYEGTSNMLPFPAIISIGAFGGILLIIIFAVCIKYRQKSRESDRVMKRMQNQMDVLEARVAKECKEAFAELQTDMTELNSDLSGSSGIPFRCYRSFCMKVLFPNVHENEHPVTRQLEIDLSTNENLDRGLRLFNQLIQNKTFLLLFIRTLETNKDFSMKMRVDVASLISVALQNRMEYHTDILKTLLAELIERAMEGRNHPKLLLRRTESIAEKMLTNWFTFLLYKFLKECAGEPLFMLYRAMKQQLDKGPVDAITNEAKYSLSEDKLIRQQIDYKQIVLRISEPDQHYGTQVHLVKVLDCDTVSQVKDKILDAIYKNTPYSSRPSRDDLDLEWRTGVKGRLILQDEDMTTKAENDYKRVNTLAHYKVTDHGEMALVQRQSSMYNLSLGSNRSGGSHHRFDGYMMSNSPSLHRSLSPHKNIVLDMDENAKYYHLVKSHDSEHQKEGDRGSKMVSEIYLTRLLATKGTLQQFVDDLFETIFSTANRGYALPLAIKYMFDFLDDQALHHGINDPEVVHTWKSNSLPLRFWINMVKNPDFVFDVSKSNIVDACLSVTAQTFMDCCSMSEHRLGKDSPSSKLLYAKDIPKYKKWVERYYQDIKLMPAISDQDMNAMLAEESRLHKNEFNLSAALIELYQYVVRYNEELMQTLEEDEFARNYRLAYKLSQVHSHMDSEV